MNGLEPLLPVLQTLEPLGLPSAVLQGWYTYANQKQVARLAKHLEYELGVINQRLSTRINHAYLKTDAFKANVIQAVRAAETAESEEKLSFIACALAGCTLQFNDIQINRNQIMRIVEQLSESEILVFVEHAKITHDIDPFEEGYPEIKIEGMSDWDLNSCLFGLESLGLITKSAAQDKDGSWLIITPMMNNVSGPLWLPTSLSRQLAALSLWSESP